MPLVPPVNVVHALAYVPDFQPTRASAMLDAWWRRTPAGVCCLVGVGGCGKTAVIDHFLRSLDVLPGGAFPPAGRGTSPREGLRPRGALVFSLAEGNPDALFHEIHLWMEDRDPGGEPAPYERVRRALAAAGQQAPDPILLVLDGMEAVQSSAGAEGAGRLLDHRVRDLVTRAAYGAFPGVCVVATTRLVPVDVELQRLPHYTRIEVDAMDPAAAAALLRARGVREDERELRRIGERYGYHALTLDLVGGYIRRVGAPPPSLALPAADPRAGGREGAAAVQGALDEVVSGYLDETLAGGELAAANTLLELLSLFRRGVPEPLVGELVEEMRDDEDLAHPGLDAGIAGVALEQLVGMRLVRRVEREKALPVFSLHEMIRDFVYDRIPPERRERWHACLAGALAAQADAVQSETGRVSPRVLDLLEETIHHQLRTAWPAEAFLIYWQRMGNFSHLGQLFSDFARGERLCRMLNLDRPPDEVAPYLHDGRGADAALLADWGLYLLALGELPRAVRVFKAADFQAMASRNLANLPISARNVADALLWTGDLRASVEWTEEGKRSSSRLLELGEGLPAAEVIRGFEENMQTAAVAFALRGEVDRAQAELDAIRDLHREAAAAHRAWARTMWFLPPAPSGEIQLETMAFGRYWCSYLLSRGALAGVRSAAGANLAAFVQRNGEEATSVELREMLAAAVLETGDADAAEEQAEAVERWASAHDSSPHLCHALLLRAGVALTRGDGQAAHLAASDGLRIARESGLGLLHIDLLAVLAEASLLLGDAEGALHASATALFGQKPLEAGVALYQAPARGEADAGAGDADEQESEAGIFPPAESGRPVLLAATHPACGYRRGEAAARSAYGEALLYRLAIDTARAEVAAGEVTPEGKARIGQGRRQLEQSLRIQESLVFPEERATHPRLQKLRARLRRLGEGVLTAYPVHADAGPAGVFPGADAAPPRPRVLISYSRLDGELAQRLAGDLEQVFSDVWIDQRRIHAGESFVGAINQALAFTTHFVLVFSRSAAQSLWVRNESAAAIALRNQGRPLRILPVAIDGSELPALLADLDVLRLYEIGYEDTLRRLVAAIGASGDGG